MPTQRQQQRTAKRNQELRALDQEIFELQSQLRGTEGVLLTRTTQRDALQLQIDTMQKPPLEAMQRIIERITFVHAVDAKISDDLLEIRGYLKSLRGHGFVAAGNEVE